MEHLGFRGEDGAQMAEQKTGNADVKAFAAKTLPTLKMHLSMAEDLQNKVGK